MDPVLGVQRDLLGQAQLLVCRLRADPAEVVLRFATRHQRTGGNPVQLAGGEPRGMDPHDDIILLNS